MASRHASSSSAGERSPERNASTSEQASPSQGVSGILLSSSSGATSLPTTVPADMDARDFLGLEPTHNPHRWVLPVVPGLSTGGNFLFGGCGLGAAIEALERTTGRPVIWATAQYLSYARPPEMMDIDVTIAVDGRNTTQARAVGRVVDREILTVNAALGERPLDSVGQWEQMPEVPPPDT